VAACYQEYWQFRTRPLYDVTKLETVCARHSDVGYKDIQNRKSMLEQMFGGPEAARLITSGLQQLPERFKQPWIVIDNGYYRFSFVHA
jgi:hypothetical protein